MLTIQQIKQLVDRFRGRSLYCACEPYLLVACPNTLNGFGYCIFCKDCKASKVNSKMFKLAGGSKMFLERQLLIKQAKYLINNHKRCKREGLMWQHSCYLHQLIYKVDCSEPCRSCLAVRCKGLSRWK